MFTSLKLFLIQALVAVGIMSPATTTSIAPTPIVEPQAIIETIAETPTATTTTIETSRVEERPVTTKPVQAQTSAPAVKSNNDVLIVVEEPAPTKVDPVVYAKPVNGSCGDVANRKLTQAPTESLCTTGDPTSVEEKDNTYSWTCMGKNGGWNASTCQAYKTEDGVCGSLANSIVPPKFNGFTKDKLCTVGFETMVTTVGQQLSWQCGGWFGGKNAMCYAIQAVDPNSVRSY